MRALLRIKLALSQVGVKGPVVILNNATGRKDSFKCMLTFEAKLAITSCPVS